jgi:hypothetical protein
MRNVFRSLGLALAFLCISSIAAHADDNSSSASPSLGQLARQIKAQKAKDTKPAKVFTNDNLEATAPLSTTTEKAVEAPAPAAATPSAPPAPHDEEYFRAQMSKLKGQLETHQRELDVLQQKLGQNQMQYYDDPNKSLQQQYSREDVNKLTDEIDAKKEEVANDNKAMDDLRDQLRHDGGDPAWLR